MWLERVRSKLNKVGCSWHLKWDLFCGTIDDLLSLMLLSHTILDVFRNDIFLSIYRSIHSVLGQNFRLGGRQLPYPEVCRVFIFK